MRNGTNGTANGANGTALGFAGRVLYNACPGNDPDRLRAAAGAYIAYTYTRPAYVPWSHLARRPSAAARAAPRQRRSAHRDVHAAGARVRAGLDDERYGRCCRARPL